MRSLSWRRAASRLSSFCSDRFFAASRRAFWMPRSSPTRWYSSIVSSEPSAANLQEDVGPDLCAEVAVGGRERDRGDVAPHVALEGELLEVALHRSQLLLGGLLGRAHLLQLQLDLGVLGLGLVELLGRGVRGLAGGVDLADGLLGGPLVLLGRLRARRRTRCHRRRHESRHEGARDQELPQHWAQEPSGRLQLGYGMGGRGQPGSGRQDRPVSARGRSRR